MPLEPIGDFKSRIIALPLEQQMEEVRKRQLAEKAQAYMDRVANLPEHYTDTDPPVNLSKWCPHCGHDYIMLVPIESYDGKRMLCKDCKAQWDTDQNGRHFLRLDLHKTICQFPGEKSAREEALGDEISNLP